MSDPEPVVRLGIVVVSYGSHALIEQNLPPLEGEAVAIVVVDNLSSTSERDAVRALASAHGWTLVETDANVGFGAGTNAGLPALWAQGCTHALLLNPDVAIEPGAIAGLLAATSRHPDALVTPRLLRPDGSTWFAGGQLDPLRGRVRGRPDVEQQGPDRWLTAACLLVPRTAWERLGGFDESFFMYWEDVDLSQRWLQLGGDLHIAHDITAVHEVGATQGSSARKSGLYGRQMCQNRLRLVAGRGSPRTRLRWVVHAPAYAWRIALSNGRRDALRNGPLLRGVVRGTIAGVWLVIRSLVTDASARSDPKGRRRARAV